MSTHLPRWVWDLLADLLDEEDTHPAYYIEAYVMSKGKHEFVRHDWCPATPLDRVPPDVRDKAREIAEYRQTVTKEIPAKAEEMTADPGPRGEPAGNISTESHG